MRGLIFIVAVLTGFIGGRAAEAEWRTLPLITNGKLNTNWVQIGYGTWEVEGADLKSRPDAKGIGLLVYTKERFGDCQLKVVFRAKDTNCNSGVYVRIGDDILDQITKPGAAMKRKATGEPTEESEKEIKLSSERLEGPWYAVHQGYEIQIDSSEDPAATAYNGTGSVYSLAKTEADYADTSKWSTFIITLAGEQIIVEMNGQVVCSFNPATDQAPPRGEWYEPIRELKRPKAGYIGLQTHDPKDIVYFREVSVRALSKKKVQR